MSLVGFAIRIATARALKAALPSSFEVLDSPQEPLDILDKPDPKPLVAIYTGHAESNPVGRALLGGEVLLHLSMQFFLPAEIAFNLGSQSIKIDTRQQGAETALDVIWRMDMNLVATYVNPAVEGLFGYTPAEWVGTPFSQHCSPEELAREFEAGGAHLIACQTERRRFHGSLEDMARVRRAVSVPIMIRDFIVDPYQIHEARCYGADMIPLRDRL